MQINWDATKTAFGSFGGFVDDCKSTDYDTDGGFWDGVGDWWGGKIYLFLFMIINHFYFLNYLHIIIIYPQQNYRRRF